jgi:transposase
MSLPLTLPDAQWHTIYGLLQNYGGLYVKQEAPTRRFVEAILWMMRSGAQWRLLPKEYGHWNTIYKRFADWADKGVWQELQLQATTDADREWLILDSTLIRAHPCAAGAPKKKAARHSKG